MNNSIFNALVFNLAWLVCVLLGSAIAVPVTVLVIAVHLKFFASHRLEIFLIALVLLLGLLHDSALIRLGWLVTPDNSVWPPGWLICLWGLFATTLNHSMKWFQRHLWVAMVVGGIAGTMTYFAGTRLTEFSLKEPLAISFAVIFFIWCIVFPLCLRLAAKMLPAR